MEHRVEYFETGQLSDCTIRVGSSSTSVYQVCHLHRRVLHLVVMAHAQDFQCHKLILAMASDFFERTFYGFFKEANLGADDPILLDNVDPEVFKFAMRFVYSQGAMKMELESVPFCIQVYKFAEEMQIKGLTQELDKRINTFKAGEMFQAFDLYQMINNQAGLSASKKILQVETGEALESHHWLHFSQDGVEEFLRMEFMDVREVALVDALLRWGRFQVQSDNDDPEDGQKVRAKIMFGLKLIRFGSMTKKEAEQCSKQLEGVLNTEEMIALHNKDWNLNLFSTFACAKEARRKKAHVVCRLPDFINLNELKTWNGWLGWSTDNFLLRRRMALQVNKRVHLLGLNFKSTHKFEQDWSKFFSFELTESRRQELLGKGYPRKREIHFEDESFIKFSPKCILEPNAKYTLVFNYLGPDQVVTYTNYSLYARSPLSADWLTVTIGSDLNFIEHEAMSMLFVKAY